MTGAVTYHRADGDAIAHVVLANPGKLNAIDIAMWRELRTLFERLQAGPDRAAPRVVMTACIEKRAPRFDRG